MGIFDGTISPVGEGFVMIKSDVELDISAVYKTTNSIDVEYIKPTVNPLPDPSIMLPNIIDGSCPTEQGSCVFLIYIEIIEQKSSLPIKKK